MLGSVYPLFPSFVKIQISCHFCRCKGTCCSLDNECFCCSEIDGCQGKLEAVTDDGELPPICLGFILVV